MDTRLKAVMVLVILGIAITYVIPTYQAYKPGGQPDQVEDKVNLGLDLQGGMYLDIEVQTEIAIGEVVRQTSQELEDLLIDNLVDYISIDTDGGTDIILELAPGEEVDLHSDTYDRFIRNFSLSQDGSLVRLSMKSEEVARIEEKAPQQALEVLRNRIDGLGISEPSLQIHGKNSILIQLPGLKDREKAIELIGPQAVLEFYIVNENSTVNNYNPAASVIKYEEVRNPNTNQIVQRIPYVLEKKVLLTGEFIQDARVQIGEDGSPYSLVSFDSIGADRFAKITKRNRGRRLAIVMDDTVQSAPVIREEILGGEASITGQFTMEEASNLALVLRSGSLPAPINIREERTVGASLGEDSVKQGLKSLLIGGVLVLFFVLIYYRVAGIFANVALLFNVTLIISILAAFGATLTLPGMAGIVLTVGMAIDANVLIFERIREELKRTGHPRAAVREGFAKAFWTIVDANITTLFGALALLQFGTGPIKGFAVTLSIGILASLFTAIVVTRLLFELVYLNRKSLQSISI